MADQPAGVGHGQDNSACQWDRYGGVGSTIVQIRDEGVTPGERTTQGRVQPAPSNVCGRQSNPYWYSSDMTRTRPTWSVSARVALDPAPRAVTTAQAVADGIPKTRVAQARQSRPH